MAMNLLLRIFLLAALLLSPDASFAYEMKSVKGDDTVKDTMGIVQIPEIRKKLKTPITVDFMGVGDRKSTRLNSSHH
jgi:hypothetical protein